MDDSQNMPVVTLTTDWNNNDYYLAAVKGLLLQMDGDVSIVDISHEIKAFKTTQAAFVIRNAYKYFPEGSVHLIFIDLEKKDGVDYIAVKADNHFFISADNGIFSLILNEMNCEIIKLEKLEKDNEKSFPGLRTFTTTAINLVKNKDFFSLGEKKSSFTESYPLRATIEENTVTGSIIYVDSYGNVITNITRELFIRIGKNQAFEILVQSKHYTLNQISTHYSQVPHGELVAIFNSANLLEIAINKGNASRLLNLGFNSSIRIEFLPE